MEGQDSASSAMLGSRSRCGCIDCKCGDDCRCLERGVWQTSTSLPAVLSSGLFGTAQASTFVLSVAGLSSMDIAEVTRLKKAARQVGATRISVETLLDKVQVELPDRSPNRLLAALACPGFEVELLSASSEDLSAVAAAATAPAPPSGTRTALLKVGGMTCASCVATVERAALGVEGVAAASVNLPAGRAEVTFRRPARAGDVVDAVEAVGFDAELVREFLVRSVKPECFLASFVVEGMTCASCVGAVERAILNVEGVTTASVNLLARRAEVSFKSPTKPRDVLDSIEAVGFSAELLRMDDVRTQEHESYSAVIAVKGMSCASCTGTVERVALAVAGVKTASVSLLHHRAEITFDRPTKAEDVIHAIGDSGFEAELLNECPIETGDEQAATSRPSEIRVSLHDGVNASALREALRGIDGIEGVVFRKDGSARILYEPTVLGARDALARLSAYCSYAGDEVYEDPSAGQKRRIRNSLILSIPPTLLVVVIVEKVVAIPHSVFLLMPVTAFVQFWCGRCFHAGAISAVRHGSLTMNTLVSLSTTVSFIYGAVASIYTVSTGAETSSMQMAGMFFETSAVLIPALLIGRLMEAAAKSKTLGAIRQLSAKRPSTATIVKEGQEDEEVSYDLVQVGDVIRVLPGELVPVDGEVCNDSVANCDEALLTGEATPVQKQRGSKVVGGSTCVRGSFLMCAEGVGQSTTLARIIQLVEDAQVKRPSVQRVADVLASVFVPIVLSIAIVAFLVWTILHITDISNKDMVFAVTRAVSVLVIACPCSLGLATPTAIMVATGQAARHGCLVKDAVVWEKTRKINHIVFDKTGTITEGRPKVVAMALLPGAEQIPEVQAPPGDALQVCCEWLQDGSAEPHALELTKVVARVGWVMATVEVGSEHPLARALLDWGKSASSGNIGEAASFENIPGRGVACVVEHVGTVRVGSLDFVEVPGGGAAAAWATSWQEEGCIVIALQVSGVPIALFALRDELQECSAAVIAALRRRGIKVWMCTGDQQTTAHAVARRVGIPTEQVKAQCLPRAKAAFIDEISVNSEVAMVGDGVNDAAALASASLGVAIGAGSHITMDSADIVLVRSALEDLLVLLELGRRTMRTIYRNFAWALLFNVVGIPLAAGVGTPWGVTLPPIFCGLAMASSSVVVVLSSLQLKCFSPRARVSTSAVDVIPLEP